MGYTNFPNGLTSMGAPVSGGGFPYNSGGKHYFTDSVNGSDSNTGKSWDKAKSSIFGTSGGYQLLRENKHDVLHVIGGATAYASTAVGAFDKDYAHVVCETAPTLTGGRARLTNTVTTATTGEFTFTGVGSVYDGLHIQHGDSATAASVIGTHLSGDGRNAFLNCHFEGPTNATVADGTALKTFKLTSTQDNLFYNCAFGARTILSSSAAGAIVEFAGTNNNANTFKKCLFLAYNSTTTSASISFVNNAMPDSGFTMFDECIFQGCANVAVADVIIFATGGHGTCILNKCALTGAGYTKWATGTWKANIDVVNTVGAATGGLAAHPA